MQDDFNGRLPEYISVDQLATMLGISRAQAYQLVHQKNGVPNLRIGKRILIPIDRLVVWLDKHTDGVA